ncbi:MlaC/ttg2D family ABC transporter substrate-binding protein [Aliagarivorans taiwanensis]|uniref:MlaC/ttg2D family ABC transporter substrate-binding protein n=1 Tax=Aliagarivorans taiwanensis TaxID=561966 RepID=UPI00041ADE3D|nr:ABC transporter substrate-binding protein [Aliagarivorans taiwanensis]
MESLKRTFLVLGVLLCTWALPLHAEDPTHDPYKLMQHVATNAFSRLAEVQGIEEDTVRQDEVRSIVQQELMPHIDHVYASFVVLGKHVRSTSKEQRAAFVAEFEHYLVNTYVYALAQYSGQEVKIEPGRDFSNKTKLGVKAQFIEKGREPINLEFKFRLHKKSGNWLAYDLVAEGVSMLTAKQSEFDSLLRRQSIEDVIELLKQRNAEGSQELEES